MRNDKKATDIDVWARQIVTDGIRRDVDKLGNGQQDRDAAESLLEEFRLDGPNVHLDVYQWLYDAFGHILNGDDPAKALGLKRKRGQKSRTGYVDKIAIAMYVELKQREGMPPPDAKSDAVNYFSREIRTIENAVREVELADGQEDRDMWDYVFRHRRPQ